MARENGNGSIDKTSLRDQMLLEDTDGGVPVRPGNMEVTRDPQQMYRPEPEHSVPQCIPRNTNLHETRAHNIGLPV